MWEFRDFVSEQGKNVIREWLNERPVRARAAIDNLILYLQAVERLDRPQVGQLHGPCEGLLELVKQVDGVQYRPIGYYGPLRRQVTLLAGAEERDRKLKPPSACETAQDRRARVEADHKRSCMHEFG